MPEFPRSLPQLAGQPFLTDGGIETTLIFHDGVPLPDFAAFDLLREEAGVRVLERYYRAYASLAVRHGVGFIFESATWRASRDWGERLGYSETALDLANRRAIGLLGQLRTEYETTGIPLVISGCLGPRGDGYMPAARMTIAEAEAYHSAQIASFAVTEADLVTAITMNYVEEAVGIARAAAAMEMPVVISFTLETDGRLPTGDSLADAIDAVDGATDAVPAYYMINCAHPTHFAHLLPEGEPWVRRIRGLRANASTRSHAELNEAPDLDIGNPARLGEEYGEICRRLPWVTVLGGCCGTDHRHLAAIAEAVIRRGARSRLPV
jgi:S-methylmethionine-dependent homocysteine/selenocysteine methylase